MSYLPAETLLVQWLIEHGGDHDPLILGVHVSTDVPDPRPGSLITVERTGGAADRFQDHPTLAVQCWAPSRWEAEQLAQAVRKALNEGFRYYEPVTRLELGAVYNFPDPDGRHPRWQLVIDVRTSAY